MFRSFFPEPKIFFPAALAWLLITTLAFFLIGEPLRSAVSVDRFLAPAICAPVEALPSDAAATPEPAGDAVATTTPDTTASDSTAANPNAPASTESAVPAATVAAANCVAEDTNFLNGNRLWEYWYVLICSVLFCVFWYFYKRNEWYWWSVVG